MSRIGGHLRAGHHPPPRHSSMLKQPFSCGTASGSPSLASSATSAWRFTASWLTTTTAPPTLRRAISVSPLTARSRTADRGSTPGARSTEPHSAAVRAAGAGDALIPVHRHGSAATANQHDRRPARRSVALAAQAGDNGGQPPCPQSRTEPPGLAPPGFIQWRVGQAPQDAGLIKRSLAMPRAR